MTKVLITGANGFIGGYLLEFAKHNADYTEVYTVSRGPCEVEEHRKHERHFRLDLSIQCEVEWLFQQIQPDVIFHLAGYPLVKVDEKNINECFRANTLTTHNLVHFCPKGCTFVLASTIIVYGDSAEFSPDYACEEFSPELPTSMYAVSKHAAEEIVIVHNNRKDIRGINARLSANVGIAATHGVLRDFIAKAKSDNPEFEILGDAPGSCKPYTYVGDTAMALIVLADRAKYPYYNVCNSDSITTERISQIVQEECGTSKPIKWLGEQANWVGDNRLLRVSSEAYKKEFHEFHCPTSESAIRQAVRNAI